MERRRHKEEFMAWLNARLFELEEERALVLSIIARLELALTEDKR